MPKKPTTIDEYLAAVPADQRAALEKLRKAIQASAPEAEECISYGLAAFRLDGKALVGFGAAASHCAFYPMSATTVGAHRDDLAGYDTSKGTVRFPANKPLPAALVRKLIRARIAENAGQKGPAYGKAKARRKPADAKTDPAVVAFLRDLDHPRKADVEAVRRIILAAGPEVREGIKWNAPSFRTADYFATVNVHARDQVRLILHRGAKAKTGATRMRIADPAGLLQWLGTDRCLVTFDAKTTVRAHRAALTAIVRAWIRQL